MIPILYDSNEINFTSNGLGRLRDCISCIVTEERNGIYECDFEYPIGGVNYDLIKLGRIIGVSHDDGRVSRPVRYRGPLSDEQDDILTDEDDIALTGTGTKYISEYDIQPFDIVSYSRPIDGVVTFHAVHISYRQSKMVSYASGIYSLADAFQTLDDVCYPSGNQFVYSTDKTSTGYCAAFDGTPRTIRSLLGGTEGSILDTYGGEFEWDKWTVKLHSARGEQKNFSIRYGVNMTQFQDDTDYSETFTSCVPFWKDSSTGAIVRGGQVGSGHSTIGVGSKCMPLDLTDKFESRPTVAQLEAMATSVLNESKPYLPKQTISVDFFRLQDEAGSNRFDSLLECKLCDSVNVVFPHYDMSAYYKIVKTTWNVLLDRYDGMELGNLSTTLAEALGISEGSSSSSKPEGVVPYCTLLWTNNSPSSPMDAQTVAAQGLSLYDEVEVLYESAHIYGGRLSQKASYEDGAWITLIGLGGSTGEFAGNPAAYLRTVTMSSDSVYIGNAVAGVDNSAYTTNNNLCIPLKIYGIKYA